MTIHPPPPFTVDLAPREGEDPVSHVARVGAEANARRSTVLATPPSKNDATELTEEDVARMREDAFAKLRRSPK
jgi:hypothetical protein